MVLIHLVILLYSPLRWHLNSDVSFETTLIDVGVFYQIFVFSSCPEEMFAKNIFSYPFSSSFEMKATQLGVEGGVDESQKG